VRTDVFLGAWRFIIIDDNKISVKYYGHINPEGVILAFYNAYYINCCGLLLYKALGSAELEGIKALALKNGVFL